MSEPANPQSLFARRSNAHLPISRENDPSNAAMNAQMGAVHGCSRLHMWKTMHASMTPPVTPA